MKKGNNIQNDKCLSCIFRVWNNDIQEYRCGVDDCHENSSYMKYNDELHEQQKI